MHLLSALLAFLFSFGHSQAAVHSEADAFVPPPQYADASFQAAIPSHREIVNGSYAVATCPGCRMTNTTSSTR